MSFVCADEVDLLAAIESLTQQVLKRIDEPGFVPQHRVPDTDGHGQVIKKLKKPKTKKMYFGAGARKA